MNAPDSNRPQSWDPDAIENALAAPAARHLTALRSTFDARLDALERALDDPGQVASLPALVLALAGAAGDEAEAAMKQACLDVRREADRVVSDLRHAVGSLQLELDRERLEHAQARTAALQAEQRMSDLESRAVEHEAVRVRLEQARHEAEVKAATAVEEAARARAEQDGAHARAVAEKEAIHARMVAERDAAHARALVERDATHAHAVGLLEQRLTTLETEAQARASREEQARRRLEEQCRELESRLAVNSRDRDRLASESAQLRLDVEVMRQFASGGGSLPRATVVTAPAAPAPSRPASVTTPPPAATTPPIEHASPAEDGSSNVFSSVADALRAWSTEAETAERGPADRVASGGASVPPRRDGPTALAQLSSVPMTVSRPIRVRIGLDDMQMVEMSRGGGEVVTPVGLEPGRQVKLVFTSSRSRVTVTAHVSWCRLEPPSAGDGLLQYRAGLSYDLDQQTFDRLSSD